MSYKTDLQNNNTGLQAILDMILALGLVDAPKLISFTIDGTSYQAVEGMTWAEWVESDYNTGEFYCRNNLIYFSSGKYVYYSEFIEGTDVIIDSRAYTNMSNTGGEN